MAKNHAIATIIDINKWRRKEHFLFFTNVNGSVRFSLTLSLDVSNLVKFCRQQKLSFYYSLIFLVTKTANEIPALRQRLRDGKPVEYDKLSPLFTDMEKEDDLFKLIMAEMNDDISSFAKTVSYQSEHQKEYLPVSQFLHRDDILNITCYPWDVLTSIQVKPVSEDSQNNTIPFIAWGKYRVDGDKFILPFHVDVCHCFLDAIHVHSFKEKIEQTIKSLI